MAKPTPQYRVTMDGSKQHLWDTETFNKAGRPVALCDESIELFPLRPSIETANSVRRCRKCPKV
jgi:hypothetical protein